MAQTTAPSTGLAPQTIRDTRLGRAGLYYSRVLLSSDAVPGRRRLLCLDVVGVDGNTLQTVLSASDSIFATLPSAGPPQPKEIVPLITKEAQAEMDRLHETGTPYYVRGMISEGCNPGTAVEVRTKSYTNNSSARPGTTSEFNYRFVNRTGVTHQTLRQITYRSPSGWVFRQPTDQQPAAWTAGGSIEGSMSLEVPADAAHGSNARATITLVDAETKAVLDERDWFQVFDTIPPFVQSMRVIVLANNQIAVQLFSDDRTSEIGSKVLIKYSSDNGTHWVSRALLAKEDPSGELSWWEGTLGPLQPRSMILLQAVVTDMAGNEWHGYPPYTTVFLAPRNAEKLLLLGNPLERNLVFEVERLQRIMQQGNKAVATPQTETDLLRNEYEKDIRQLLTNLGIKPDQFIVAQSYKLGSSEPIRITVR